MLIKRLSKYFEATGQDVGVIFEPSKQNLIKLKKLYGKVAICYMLGDLNTDLYATNGIQLYNQFDDIPDAGCYLLSIGKETEFTPVPEGQFGAYDREREIIYGGLETTNNYFYTVIRARELNAPIILVGDRTYIDNDMYLPALLYGERDDRLVRELNKTNVEFNYLTKTNYRKSSTEADELHNNLLTAINTLSDYTGKITTIELPNHKDPYVQIVNEWRVYIELLSRL